jgi:hypothetical protein
MLIGLLALPASAFAQAGWHSEQPVAVGIGVPVPIGKVGDIEFWAPNRGLLITAGNATMPAGIYAYDGIGWHLYSTVCGGSEGRIAWAGPTEFWTISDVQGGQETFEGTDSPAGRSLCHFKDGAVVASYAEPLNTSTTYPTMRAAACSAPQDCWFAGDRLSSGAANSGAFHLHWDGSALTAVPFLTEPQPGLIGPARSVADLSFAQDHLFESVQVQDADGVVAGEESEPSFLHRVDLGAAKPFEQLFPAHPITFSAVKTTKASSLGGFRLVPGGGGLFGIAGAASPTGADTANVEVTAVRYQGGGLAQLPLHAAATEYPFQKGDVVLGAAGEPGSDGFWVAFRRRAEGASNGSEAVGRVALVHGDGSVEPAVGLPGQAEGIGRKGFAGPIACPASEQCWMATSKGWLFHRGDPVPQDTASAMRVLITYRPPDDSVPFVPPVELPLDDSGSEAAAGEAPPQKHGKRPRSARRKALVTKVRQKVLDKTLLRLTFTLAASAHVRLVAKRHRQPVAQTPRLTLGKGPHRLFLRLDPERWPTSLDFQVHAVRGRGKR